MNLNPYGLDAWSAVWSSPVSEVLYNFFTFLKSQFNVSKSKAGTDNLGDCNEHRIKPLRNWANPPGSVRATQMEVRIESPEKGPLLRRSNSSGDEIFVAKSVQLARYMDDLKFLNGTYNPVRSLMIWLGDHELDVPSGKEYAHQAAIVANQSIYNEAGSSSHKGRLFPYTLRRLSKWRICRIARAEGWFEAWGPPYDDQRRSQDQRLWRVYTQAERLPKRAQQSGLLEDDLDEDFDEDLEEDHHCSYDACRELHRGGVLAVVIPPPPAPPMLGQATTAIVVCSHPRTAQPERREVHPLRGSAPSLPVGLGLTPSPSLRLLAPDAWIQAFQGRLTHMSMDILSVYMPKRLRLLPPCAQQEVYAVPESAQDMLQGCGGNVDEAVAQIDLAVSDESKTLCEDDVQEHNEESDRIDDDTANAEELAALMGDGEVYDSDQEDEDDSECADTRALALPDVKYTDSFERNFYSSFGISSNEVIELQTRFKSRLTAT
ncbi:hypothetical protein CNMCM7691_007310 [Aspergillus felis]|uniref:Uncharacterized protein n=1 Tax=Aspergillus felis TaxID=1287682 RepID=A0A8H6V2J3_9EURO|nr:hypothetical protein CNMCM7691_007310 [Aspergillus felis]